MTREWDDPRRRFESIVDEVYQPLQRYLGRRLSPQDAEEALDDVLLVIWRRIEETPEDALLAWAYGIARGTLANRRRTLRRRDRLMERLKSQAATESVPGPSDGANHPEVVAAVAKLAPRDREVLVLWAWEQLEPKEIAVVLDTTANAVSIRLTRARRKLHRVLRKGGGPAGHVSDGDTGRRI